MKRDKLFFQTPFSEKWKNPGFQAKLLSILEISRIIFWFILGTGSAIMFELATEGLERQWDRYTAWQLHEGPLGDMSRFSIVTDTETVIAYGCLALATASFIEALLLLTRRWVRLNGRYLELK